MIQQSLHAAAEMTIAERDQARLARAKQIVADMCDDLTLAAEAGQLDGGSDFGFTVTVRHLGARATLWRASTLVGLVRSLHEETRARQRAPQADCANTWAQPWERSCREKAFAEHQQRYADELAVELVDGPWPI